jgi:hypothetical protein
MLHISPQELEKLQDLLLKKNVANRKWRQSFVPMIGGAIEWVEGVLEEKPFTIPANLDVEDAAIVSEIYNQWC